ncbi:MAG: hypothetical protein WCG25_08710 [bacterium]
MYICFILFSRLFILVFSFHCGFVILFRSFTKAVLDRLQRSLDICSSVGINLSLDNQIFITLDSS